MLVNKLFFYYEITSTQITYGKRCEVTALRRLIKKL